MLINRTENTSEKQNQIVCFMQVCDATDYVARYMEKQENPMTVWQLPEEYFYNGHSVRYAICGGGPPVVMVHGTPWSSYNLRHIINALSKNFTVYYYDFLGYGQSAKPNDDVSLNVQNQILSELLDHWQLKQPAIIGHDFGGATLLRAHILNSRDFCKIVLIDPVAVSPWGSQFFQHVKTHEAAFAGVPDYIHEAIVRAYVQTAAFKPIDINTLNIIVEPWLKDSGKEAFYRQIAQSDSAHTDAVQPFYSKISCPVLILWGQQDTWIPLERGQALHNMIPDSTLHIIPNAGHLVIEEEPNQLIEEICSFFSVEQNHITT